MTTRTRRGFLKTGTAAGLGMLSTGAARPAESESAAAAAAGGDAGWMSLNGSWLFRLDPDKAGDAGAWHKPGCPADGWASVTVPHTWQVSSASAGYYGVAWYRRHFTVPSEWRSSAVRVRFEAVFHTARVWVNDQVVGEHVGKGYTAFTLDIGRVLVHGGPNEIVVRVDNAFNDAMLPRGRSSDWTHDGGIYRPVTILRTPPAFIEALVCDAVLSDEGHANAALTVAATVRNSGALAVRGGLAFQVRDPASGQVVLAQPAEREWSVQPGGATTIRTSGVSWRNPKLWHFDRPNLYVLDATFAPAPGAAVAPHSASTSFGLRRFETRDAGFYLNGERVRVMGVERMAGSHPEYGMAEPADWIAHDHDDLKALNCVFTRVHWPQDQRVLDYADRAGMLVQLEVPTWGPETFQKMGNEPLPALMENGLEQLRELIEQNRHHPSVVAWGLCNEIDGKNPAAAAFARRMYDEAKRLDPGRPCTYASNSLTTEPGRDVAGLMDFVEFNEYYETWFGGDIEALRRNLDAIRQAFPGKAIVISEYGYCACTSDRPEGDNRRMEILREHDRVFREHDEIAGLIFFCYNDYRTHQGDKGRGVMKQRVHGVVDVYGRRKPSYNVLRAESSPVEELRVSRRGKDVMATVRTRKSVPSYALERYTLRWVVYDSRGTPVEKHDAELPRLAPGDSVDVPVRFDERDFSRVEIDVVRPTGFSALSAEWKP